MAWRCIKCQFLNDEDADYCAACARWRMLHWTQMNPEQRREALRQAHQRLVEESADIVRRWYAPLTQYEPDENYVNPLEWEEGHTVGD